MGGVGCAERENRVFTQPVGSKFHARHGLGAGWTGPPGKSRRSPLQSSASPAPRTCSLYSKNMTTHTSRRLVQECPWGRTGPPTQMSPAENVETMAQYRQWTCVQGQARPESWARLSFSEVQKKARQGAQPCRLGREDFWKGRERLARVAWALLLWLGSRWPGCFCLQTVAETHAADWSSCSCVDKERERKAGKERGTELSQRSGLQGMGLRSLGLRSPAWWHPA